MNTFKIKTMAQPTPSQIDVTALITYLSVILGIIVVFFKWINSYFASKAKEQQEFIEKVAVACVKATLDSAINDVKEDIKILFKYRDEDRKHLDTRLDKVISEIKK